MKDFKLHPAVTELAETAANMYRLGWDERNSGNISILLEDNAADSLTPSRVFALGFEAAALAGRVMLVTGTGKYFKNMVHDPENGMGVIRISADGKSAQLLWGLSDGTGCTSELATHLLAHETRLKCDPQSRVVMHSHPPFIVAMSHMIEADDRKFTRALWEMCTESILVFPEGVGALPWMPCGTEAIGRATAEKLLHFRLVIWALHGIYGTGRTMDETFGLIETVEKAAQVYMLTADRQRVNFIGDDGLRKLAESFHLDYRREFLEP